MACKKCLDDILNKLGLIVALDNQAIAILNEDRSCCNFKVGDKYTVREL